MFSAVALFIGLRIRRSWAQGINSHAQALVYLLDMLYCMLYTGILLCIHNVSVKLVILGSTWLIV
jgi:hypothetical protein